MLIALVALRPHVLSREVVWIQESGPSDLSGEAQHCMLIFIDIKISHVSKELWLLLWEVVFKSHKLCCIYV